MSQLTKKAAPAPTNSALAWMNLYEVDRPNREMTWVDQYWAARDLAWDGDTPIRPRK